jgi:hypothetical protein
MAACILVAASGTGTLQAQALYICATSTGNSYQQVPCGGSERLVRSLVTSPEAPPSAAVLAQRSKEAEEDRAESAFLSRRAGTDQANAPRGDRRTAVARARRHASASREYLQAADACRTARADRGRVLQAVGLERTIELMRRLDAAVWAACSH